MCTSWCCSHTGTKDGSPVLVVIGNNSFWRVRGFESWCCILDGHDMICYKSYIVCLKRPKINGKEAGVGPFKKSVAVLIPCWFRRSNNVVTFCRISGSQKWRSWVTQKIRFLKPQIFHLFLRLGFCVIFAFVLTS